MKANEDPFEAVWNDGNMHTKASRDVIMSKLSYFIILSSIVIASIAASATPSPALEEPIPQGMGPTRIAITEDGEYAYIGFHLSDTVFKVRLEDLNVEAVADLSTYFPIGCYNIALDASGKKLFIHSASWRKLFVLDTQTMSIIHVIDNIGTVGMTRSMFRSQYGPYLIIWDSSNTVKFVNTETYEVTELTDDNIWFMQIEESRSEQGKWYVATQVGPREGIMGLYDYRIKKWDTSISITTQQEGLTINDLKVLPGEKKAYMAIWGGFYLEDQTHGYGWVYSIDLAEGEVKVIPIDGDIWCLGADPDGRWVYVGADWPKPRNVNNIQVVDTKTDTVVDSIDLNKLALFGTQFSSGGTQFTSVVDLQIDPVNPRFLYAVSNDGNALIKVDLDNRTLADALVFNEESFEPNFLAKGPMQNTGYILIHQSANAFELDLDNATIKGFIRFPAIRTDIGSYDVATNDAGNLLIAQGENMLEVDPKDMSLIKTHPLPASIGGLSHFVLSNDRTRIYAIQDFIGGQEHSDVFVALDAATFQVIKRIKVEGGVFNERPFELPDGSKVYALGGWDWGTITVHAIETGNYTIKKTITYDDPDNTLGISAGPYFPFAYDPSSHTLFVGAGTVVLAINTDVDEIEQVIELADSGRAIGFEPTDSVYSFVYVNAIGLIYDPKENHLYIVHLDRAFVSIYDLGNDRFLPHVIPLEGFFPSYAFANDDINKIYILNGRSDSVSVIDVKSKALEKVIDLHGGWVSVRAVPDGASIVVDGAQYEASGAFEWIEGSVHAISAPESVPLGEGERLSFSGWEDGNGSLSRSVRVTGPAGYVAVFRKQYYLYVISDYGSPTGSGWYDDGAIATVDLASGEVPAEFPYANVFVGWGGDAQGNNPSSQIQMDGPKTAIARWERRLGSSFYASLGGMVFGMALLAIILLLRRKVPPKEGPPPPQTPAP